jgi:hypothetical protein
MQIDLNDGSNFLPFIRWYASTQSWTLRADGEDQNVLIETAAFDFQNLKLGWGLFSEGAAPDWSWDNGARAAKPSPDHKRGFSIPIYAPKAFGEAAALAVWESTARGSCIGMERLTAQIDENQIETKVAVVKFNGASPERIGKGATSVPILELVKYVDRPDGMDDAPAPVETDSESPEF